MNESQNSAATLSTSGLPQLTPESINYLLKAAKWGKFLAILGFIVSGLMIAGGIMMSFVLNKLSDEMVPLDMSVSPLFQSIFYVAFAGIFLIPVIFLNTFSNNVMKAVNLSNTEKMTASLKNLKNLFVFFGVATIVLLLLYILILIVAGTATIFSL